MIIPRRHTAIAWLEQTSPALAQVHARVRSRVPILADDRAPSPDIIAIAQLIASDAIGDACDVRVK